jgi:hypothetical protein
VCKNECRVSDPETQDAVDEEDDRGDEDWKRGNAKHIYTPTK